MPQVQATKERTDILDIIKIKNLCVSKDILLRKEKDNPQNGKKIFGSHKSRMSLVSRIYEECLQLNSEDNSILKQAKGFYKYVKRPISTQKKILNIISH